MTKQMKIKFKFEDMKEYIDVTHNLEVLSTNILDIPSEHLNSMRRDLSDYIDMSLKISVNRDDLAISDYTASVVRNTDPEDWDELCNLESVCDRLIVLGLVEFCEGN